MIKNYRESSSIRRAVVMAVASVLAVGTSVAGETSKMVMETTPAAPTMTWTGFYLGVQAGGVFNPDDDGRLSFDTDRNGDYNDSIAAFGNNFDGSFDSSFSYGVHAGYDYQIGHFVVGILADINKMEVSEDQSGFSSTPAFYREERSLEYVATARLRAGYAFNERLLAYATGGAAYGDQDYQTYTDTPATVRIRDDGGDDIGYTSGGGLEARVSEHVSVTVEYLYTNLGESDYVTNYSGPAAFSTVSASTDSRGADRDFDFHTVQAKVSYRF